VQESEQVRTEEISDDVPIEERESLQSMRRNIL
jgi:hypothetical protein